MRGLNVRKKFVKEEAMAIKGDNVKFASTMCIIGSVFTFDKHPGASIIIALASFFALAIVWCMED